MLETWQNLPTFINPVLFNIGPISIRWYSLGYLAAFLTVYLLLRFRIAKKECPDQSSLHKDFLEDFFVISIIGLVIGARLGYLIFYDLSNFISHPLASLIPFQNGSFTGFFGLSYHGGLIGAIIAGMFFCKKKKIRVISFADFIIPAIPLGYMWGRIGNFMNGELFGRETALPFGMHFQDETLALRHPSQLYESFGEGLLLFLVLWPLRNNHKLKNKLLGLYLIMYGVVRFFIEFLREPDAQLGKVLLGLTMGQLLCFCMIIAGLIFLYTFKNHQENENSSH